MTCPQLGFVSGVANENQLMTFCQNVISSFEPIPEYKQNELIGIDGLTAFFLSQHCGMLDPRHQSVHQVNMQKIGRQRDSNPVLLLRNSCLSQRCHESPCQTHVMKIHENPLGIPALSTSSHLWLS